MGVITTKANIAKITRQVGKAEVQIVLTIPVGKSADIPMGDVIIKVEATQKDMFAKADLGIPGGAGGNDAPGSRQRFGGTRARK